MQIEMSNQGTICAGIVLYNPDINKLKNNIEHIYKQVSCVFIVDNGSRNVCEIDSLIRKYSNVYMNELDNNYGIAKALNVIANEARGKGFKWLLTLDQDSECLNHIIENYEKHIILERAGLISCLYCDRNFDSNQNEYEGVRKIEWCITSASLLNLDIWHEVRGFDEFLFIDAVDYDFCLTLKEKKYYTYQIGFIGFTHEIGEGKIRNIGSLKIKTWNHSPFRRYYSTRNVIIVAKKHNTGVIKATLGAIKHTMLIFLFEDEKYSKLKRAISGMIDGFKYKKC